jgi:hemolysin activation/secretion protein
VQVIDTEKEGSGRRRGETRRATPLKALAFGLLLVMAPATFAWAQLPPPRPLDPTGRTGEPPPFLQEQPRPPAPPPQILPPLSPPPPRELERLVGESVFVREIRIVGNSIFTVKELDAVTAPYLNRELTAEDLEALRVALTFLYVNRGYINSGAILPDQDVAAGVVTYRIVEGELTRIDIVGNRWFWPYYLRSRLRLGAGPPLNVNDLQERLRFLLEDPRIAKLNAALKPGTRPGESVLDVLVEERHPFRLTLEVNNYQSPSVGAERGLVTLEDLNLTGNGDILTVQYGKSEGLDPLLDLRYALPFTPWDTTLSFQYRKNTLEVIDEQFKALEIHSDSEIFTITLRQPVFRSLSHEVALELTGERLSQTTTLLGEPFSLQPGARNGEAVVSAIRPAAEWIYRTGNQVIAARSRFSFGIDALGSTVHQEADIPDSEFFVWLGQFQWVRRFRVLLDTQLLFRADAQLTHDRLLTLEQIAIGGRYSVRGYRENTLVRDNGVILSAEARVPVVRNRRWTDYLELVPFVDFGKGWNEGPADDKEINSLSSVGIGLRWGVTVPWFVSFRPALEIYWGYPLRRDIKTKGNPQDDGIHFRFAVAVF